MDLDRDGFIVNYQHLHREWHDRLNSSLKEARNWRFFSLVLLLVAFVSMLAFLACWFLQPVKLFVAEVTQDGRVVNVLPLQKRYHPKEAEERYFIGNFIKLVKNLPLDPVVAKQNWLTAYKFLNQRGGRLLGEYFRKEDFLSLLGKETVFVEILTVNAVNKNSFEARWVESRTDLSGQNLGRRNFLGTFTIAVKPPTSEEQILSNPLGIYIVDFNISKE